MYKNRRRRQSAGAAVFAAFIVLAVTLVFLSPLHTGAQALTQEQIEENTETARPSVNGRLHVEGTQLADESGRSVQLRGVSTHGLTWYPGYVNEGLFRQLAQDWNCNFVRLAMYSSVYCGGQKEKSLEILRRGIDAAIAADMYVLVDWHILEDYDPNINADSAAEFFDLITSEYADCPNLLFEICNEPNQETNWSDVLEYSEKIIPVIRGNIPDAVIAVGTPEYDRNLGDAQLRPLSYDNVMYVLHFYAASHKEDLLDELKAAVEAGLPVMISECGISESDGDGTIDFASAANWFSYLNEKKISYAVWSLSDKDESSAFFRPGFEPDGKIRDEDLTVSGRWVRDLIRGEDPEKIAAPAAFLEKDSGAVWKSRIRNSLGTRGIQAVRKWQRFAAAAVGILLLAGLAARLHSVRRRKKRLTYDDIYRNESGPERNRGAYFGRNESGPERNGTASSAAGMLCLLGSIIFTLIYLGWRILYSVPVKAGPIAIGGNLLLLAVEILGFAESIVLFCNLLGMKNHPLPEVPDDAWPEVDVFIATYNEPADLLRRTINGCVHMKYPDPSKVHIWICDDNRRPQIRALAEEMGVGYFDRPDNTGAKAGNLNHALSLTGAPYVVTFDADMIPKSDFLLKTIPYFVDVEIREQAFSEKERLQLGFLQTPQCFYDPDLFQHALYSEKRAPNEQDFFYRTIEPAKTGTNSVIYGGSNTVLSRKALEEIGGFYTGSITEDFATGLLIESAGYVSLGLPEPLASGQTPHTFREHIQQRARWGRGVIATGKKLKIQSRKDLTAAQKINYWSSIIYWYSPVKNLIYMLSPLLYAVLCIPVFSCNWLELLVFWLPMFLMQDLSLRVNSRGTISHKWSGIYETSVMPHLLVPILKETAGITFSTFLVTDKTAGRTRRQSDVRAMMPFIFLSALSVAGIIRLAVTYEPMQTISILILLFWLIRNLYFLIMAIFLVDGRDSDSEPVHVRDAEMVTLRIRDADGSAAGITTHLTEHNMTVYLDEKEDENEDGSGENSLPGIGTPVEVTVESGDLCVHLKGVITGILNSRRGNARTYTIEILDFGKDRYEYWQLLYDRIPTLPQSLQKDFGILPHLWQNIAHRVARTRK